MSGPEYFEFPSEKDKEMIGMVDRAGYLAIAEGNLREAQNCLDVAESIMVQDMEDQEYKDLCRQFKSVGEKVWELEKMAKRMMSEHTWDIVRKVNPPEGEE